MMNNVNKIWWAAGKMVENRDAVKETSAEKVANNVNKIWWAAGKMAESKRA